MDYLHGYGIGRPMPLEKMLRQSKGTRRSANGSEWLERTGDFSSDKRRRAGHTDRIRGVFFSDTIPPMTDT